MSNDKMRKSAEDFFKVPFEKMDVFMQRAWETCWKDSREALVIELPKSRAERGERSEGIANKLSALMANQLAIDECRKAIEAAGVKVK